MFNGAIAEATDLFKAYSEWCKRNGDEAMNQTRFGRQMTERGFMKRRNSTTGRYEYLGVGLRSPVQG